MVLGRVVVNQAVPSLKGRKLLWIQPLDADGEDFGPPCVAVDTTQSGPGVRVFFVRSREAANALDDPFCPADAAILGIIDESRHDLVRDGAGDLPGNPLGDPGRGSSVDGAGGRRQVSPEGRPTS
jgi:microcompartment protein CcmK/EutM